MPLLRQVIRGLRATPAQPPQFRRSNRGSILTARRAAARHAASATTERIAATPANVSGSTASIWNSSDCITRASTAAPTSPAAMPAATGRIPSRSTRLSTPAGSAPSAIRSPSSLWRWFTENATTPYRPTAASASDATPNTRSSTARKRGCATDAATI